MAGTLFSTDSVDKDGRQLVLSDNIRDVYYYSATNETWDKEGAASQSWHRELYIPNDSFDTAVLSSDKWEESSSVSGAQRTFTHSNGLLSLGVEESEGSASISSDGKWRLSGDFDIRLYLDWDSYYNEYRSITHTFLRVGHDSANAVRVSFAFDGVDGYQFQSQVTEDRDPLFFDWQLNGSVAAGTIANASNFTYLKITRENGLVKTFTSTGTADTQIGPTISGSLVSRRTSLIPIDRR